MFEKPTTIGELIGNDPLVKLEDEMICKRGRKPKNFNDKLQTFNDDLSNYPQSDANIKQQQKYQNENLKLQAQSSKPTNKVLSLVTWTQKDASGINRTHKIQITNFQKQKQDKEIPVYVQHSKLDIWNPEKRLLTQGHGQHLIISNLIEIPQEKHVLNRPQPFDNSDPRKKKMYRPPVPRIFYGGYDSFLDRRIQSEKPGHQIDLSIKTLQQVLQQCYNKKLITLSLFSIFMSLNGTYHIKTFLQAWVSGTLHNFDYETSFFTLVDHRRLSQLLIYFYPKEYTLGSIQSLHMNIKQFLTKLYLMNAQDYVKVYQIMDSLSQNPWWNELKKRYKNTVHQNYFKIKQQLTSPNLMIQNYQSPQEKSLYVRQKLGALKLQNNQAELQKILSNKFTKNNHRTYNQEESIRSVVRQDNFSEDMGSNLIEGEDSSERDQNVSPLKTISPKSVKSTSGPDWDQLFGINKQNQRKYFDQEQD